MKYIIAILGCLFFLFIALWLGATICMADDITVTVPDTANIQIPIHQKTEVGQYNDAIYCPVKQWPTKPEDIAKKEEDINNQAKKLVDDWVSLVKNPPPPTPVTKESLQADIDSIQAQIDDLTARKTLLSTELTAIQAEAIPE